MASFYFIKM
ncbi:hypothetical protein EYZ11_012922 [Aspergillus tanneri]|uniref:Uncharacterized protein n=1 Tax=Aspergillus tanneri TaxID=1220188 RepID=A0A4S3IZ10_9EURO|nr:hypothetical protein EYZ11_012922 [Aspergillus tanneri]